MEGPWPIPNMGSEPPGKARWLATGNPQEITHITDLAHVSDLTHVSLTVGARLCLSLPVCLPTCYPFPASEHCIVSPLPISMQKFISIQLAGQGLVIGHWSLVARMSHCYRDWALPQSLGRNWSLPSSCYRLSPPNINTKSQFHVHWSFGYPLSQHA